MNITEYPKKDELNPSVSILASIQPEPRQGYTGYQLVAGIAGGFGLGLAAGYSLKGVNSRTVVNTAIQCAKKFTTCCIISGFVNFPMALILGSILHSMIPYEPARIRNQEHYLSQALNPFNSVLKAPIKEELKYRGLIQDLLLSRILRFVIQKLAPGHETLLDSKIAKLLRIGITAFLFGKAHLRNGHSGARVQAIITTLLGIQFGYLKESEVGILGAIGAHMGHNACAYASLLLARNREPNRQIPILPPPQLQEINLRPQPAQQQNGHDNRIR